MHSLKTALATVIVPGLACVLAPHFILEASHQWVVPRIELLQLVAIPIVVVGAWMVIWVSVAFVRHGKGTPIPLDPPAHLVVHGLYRYVRNPMYVGAILLVIAEVVFFAWLWLVVYAAALWLALDAFTMFIEEPQLKRRFGESYLAYLQEVPRWVPRLRSGPSPQQRQ
jgi:protein-S-isoprenylcysteine O-methyltransferase Ste14